MQSNSIRWRAMKAGSLAAITLGWLAFAGQVQAGQYQLLADQANTVVVAARVQNAEQVCNLEIAVQGQPVVEREVQAPYFEARIDITPQDVESVTVTWRGKFKRVNDVAVNACPTQGRTQYAVVADNAVLRAMWGSLLSQMGPAKAECVRTALQAERVRYEWFDLNDRQVSPEDWRIQRALTQCDGFVTQKKAWGDQNPKSFACVLPGGLKTLCEGYYTATENKPWSTGVRETAAAKAVRHKKEQALQARIAAEEAAKIKAEEEARLREAQLAQEAKEAQARERKEKAEADHARRLKEIERREQERLEKRSWLLKQLEKLKSDPKADGKAEDGKSKEDKPEAAAPKEPSKEPPAEEPKPK